MGRSYTPAKLRDVIYAADFETTTDPDDCRVWLWGVMRFGTNDLEWGKDLDSFMERISYENARLYFHNLKFDAHFIIDYLLRRGYRHVTLKQGQKPGPREFNILMSAQSRLYELTVTWETGFTMRAQDSAKKLPMTLRAVAESFDLEVAKGEIDYDKPRPVGYEPTEEELEYLYIDCRIVVDAMGEVLATGAKKLTVGSDALTEYKKLIGNGTFKNMFPMLDMEMDREIRRAYRGGFTYADPRFKGRIVGEGNVYDVNSLYPYIMHERRLPYGYPTLFDYEPPEDLDGKLAIFSVTFTAKIKPNHIPCIQIKGSTMFGETEYLRDVDEPTTLTITNVDLELWYDHYDITIHSWNGGWLFKAAVGMFDAYIEKWAEIKENSVGGQRQIAKLYQNALYGKFATNTNITGRYPILEDDRVRYVLGAEENRDPIYTPVGVFVTSWARDLTIRAAQANYDVFAYADTDSLHLISPDHPEGLTIHPTKLGAWKHEYTFENALFVGSKRYFERMHDGTYHNAIAGVPVDETAKMTFEDVTDGLVIHGKLVPKSVPGGYVLQDTPYTLKF